MARRPRTVVLRSHNDHPQFPDAISIIGAPEEGDGLVLEYFDDRGVRRTYNVSIADGVMRWRRDAPGFDQRMVATLGDDEFEANIELATDARRREARHEGHLPPPRGMTRGARTSQKSCA